MKQLFAGLLLLLCANAVLAAPNDPCPANQPERDWSTACFDTIGAERRVKPQYVRNIRVKKNGIATIRLDETLELLAVDRRGVVVIPGIYFTGDFDYPAAPGNVGRSGYTRRDAQGKYLSSTCGYFNTVTFKVLIPAVYDDCIAFHDNVARVCTGCVRYCTDEDCHMPVQVGGVALTLNRRNKVLARSALGPLDTACWGARPVKVDRERLRLACPPNDPFTPQTP